MLPKKYKIRCDNQMNAAISPTLSILGWKRDSQGGLVYDTSPDTPTFPGAPLADNTVTDSDPIDNTGDLFEGAHGRISIPLTGGADGSAFFYLQISEDGVNYADVSTYPIATITDVVGAAKSAGFEI